MKKSFTITEVIVAIGIFGVGVLAILTYFTMSTQFARLSRQITTTTNLAQEVIEENIALSYESLAPGTGSRVVFSSDPTNPYYPYEKQINISLIDSDLNPSINDVGLKKIDVFVYWTSMGSEKNVQISTIVSQR